MQIVVSELGISFGQREVFRDFSATFAPGVISALVGPSGSGKSTLLAILAGLVSPSVGTVSLVSNGTEYLPDPALVAWAPQGTNCLPGRTVLDNAMIGPLSGGASMDTARTMATEALSQVGLGTRHEELARNLSGGELQRLSFARAVAAGRPLVFADEPTSNLDRANTDRIAGLLRELSTRSTVVVATHDPVIAAAAGAVVEIRGTN